MDGEMLALLRKTMEFDSTSGNERALGEWLLENLDAPVKESFEVGDGTLDLLFSWGEPRIVFCTHMDTVPPYIPPTFGETEVRGRGACDAKGQMVSLYAACKKLEAAGRSGFALLVVSGEETGSWGAKAFSRTGFEAPVLVIGEPTENVPVSASKGTKSFDLRFTGKAFHSGYPQFGRSAVELFVDFMVELEYADFPKDPLLGDTTYNAGLLRSDNPQNILSPELTCRIYFRTTFASDDKVVKWMTEYRHEGLEVTPRGGDAPAAYHVPEGFKGRPAAFGSDAPHLTGFARKIICGPGSIKVAHRDDEHVLIADLDKAVDNYIRIYESCN
jgi:acetylornithine deacetylase